MDSVILDRRCRQRAPSCDSGTWILLSSHLLTGGRGWWTAESWIHGKWEAALQRQPSGILESWNLGMCSKFGIRPRSGILESWNVRSIYRKTIWLHVNRRFQDYRFHSLGKRGVRGFQTWSRIAHSMIPRSTGDMRTTDILTFHESRIHASLPAAWSVAQVQVTQAV